MGEIWLPIQGFPHYEVSSIGQVRSVSSGTYRIRRTYLRDGYPRLDLWRDGEYFNRCVHQLVAVAFLGPAPDGMEVCHRDGDKLNNSVVNLRYGTSAENQRDQVRLGVNANTRKTHCPKGHPYCPENTYRHRDGRRRSCRICAFLRKGRYEQAERLKAAIEDVPRRLGWSA